MFRRPGFLPTLLVLFSLPLVVGQPAAGAGWAPLMRAGLLHDEGERQSGNPIRTGSPYRIAVGDFNGDGLPDLATSNTSGFGPASSATTVSVLLHAADPDYPRLLADWVNVTVPEIPGEIAATDFNRDGKQDLIVASLRFNVSSSISVLLSTGASFRPAKVYLLGSRFGGYVKVGDLNGDGFPDVVASDSAGVGVMMNVNGDSLSPIAYYGNGKSTAIADVTGDGFADLVVVAPGGATVRILPGNNTGSFNAPAITLTPPNAVDEVKTALLNGDAIPDLVGNAANGLIPIWLGTGGGGFQAPITTGAGIEADYIATGDLDGDGDTDIVVTPAGDRDIVSNLVVLRNNGNATFVRSAFAGLPQRSETALVDVNLDGRPDVVAPTTDIDNPNTHTVGVLFNDGVGGFIGGLHSFVSNMSIREVVADFNGDGKPDVAAVDSLGITLGLGDGTGSFGRSGGFSTGSSTASTLVAGDVNRDGKMDLLVQLGSQFRVYQGNGNGTFTLSATVNGILFRRSIADIDRNGAPDLVVAGSGTLVVLRPNPAPPFWVTGTPQTETVGLGGICIGDWNRDGTPDVALAGGNGLATFPVSPVTNDLTSESLVFTGRSYADVCTGDFNRDGKPDLAAREFNQSTDMSSDRGIDVFLGQGDGTFVGPTSFGTVEQYYGPTIDTWDANRDGILDLIASGMNWMTSIPSPAEVDLLLGDGEGHFGLRTSYAVGVTSRPFFPRPITVGDVDRNGVPDVLSGAYTPDSLFSFVPTISLYTILASPPVRSSGLGTTAFYSSLNAAGRVALGDLNRDGKLDAVTARLGVLPAIAVHLGTGNGVLGPMTSLSQSWYASSLALGDLNRDGILDIVGSNSANGLTRVSSYLGAGDGTFGTENAFYINPGNDLEIGDMNRDGIPDVVAAGGDSVQVLLGTGTGTFIPLSPGGTAFARPCWDLDLADLNRDGILDVVVAGDKVSVIYGQPAGVLGAPVTLTPVLTACRTVCVADFNRDGFPDILAHQLNSYYIYWGAASSPFTTNTLTSLPFGAMDLKVGEAQADGVPFVYASRSPDRLELLSVGPTGTLTQVGTYPVTSTPAELALGDMDRDGIVDVVTIQSDGNGGSISVTPHASGVVSGVPGAPPVAARTMLAQNVPNPFNPSTEIRFRLASPDDARLAVYDVRGRLVRVLRDGHFEAGEYKTAWNGMDQGGHAVGSGVYFYDLTTASGVREAKRMILLK